MLTTTAEINVATGTPDRMIMVIPGLTPRRARVMALYALREIRGKMPKMSGAAASRMQPLYAKGYFGVMWGDNYVWFQDHGIQPFTMKNLAGKTIPMWIDDPTGKERRDNPKAKTRTTASGKQQILIFRKVALPGTTKTTIGRDKDGSPVVKIKPASFPGAPGRINNRQAPKPFTTRDKKGGRIAGGNVGVKWRHPGLAPREFLNNGLTMAAQKYGILPIRVYATDRNFRNYMTIR